MGGAKRAAIRAAGAEVAGWRLCEALGAARVVLPQPPALAGSEFRLANLASTLGPLAPLPTPGSDSPPSPPTPREYVALRAHSAIDHLAYSHTTCRLARPRSPGLPRQRSGLAHDD